MSCSPTASTAGPSPWSAANCRDGGSATRSSTRPIADAARAALDARRRALIFVETISNPLLRVADLAGLAAVAREAGIPLIVDNTFAPLICRPLEHGASLVMHSVTKMIGGHSDLTLGALVGDRGSIEPARVAGLDPRPDRQPVRELAGAARPRDPQPADGPRLRDGPRAGPPVRGASRRRRGCTTRASPRTPTSPSPTRLLGEAGGTIVTIDLGTRAEAEAFIRALAASIPFAPSLGDVQTTLSHPATTSHRGQDAAALARQGITAGMVRVSVGLEDPEDLWREFRAALDVHRSRRDGDAPADCSAARRRPRHQLVDPAVERQDVELALRVLAERRDVQLGSSA